jgi:hypothetical protein
VACSEALGIPLAAVPVDFKIGRGKAFILLRLTPIFTTNRTEEIWLVLPLTFDQQFRVNIAHVGQMYGWQQVTLLQDCLATAFSEVGLMIRQASVFRTQKRSSLPKLGSPVVSKVTMNHITARETSFLSLPSCLFAVLSRSTIGERSLQDRERGFQLIKQLSTHVIHGKLIRARRKEG